MKRTILALLAASNVLLLDCKPKSSSFDAAGPMIDQLQALNDQTTQILSASFGQ
jgi:hypothetical protein